MSECNTLTKEALGSVHYISPEQAKGGRVDSRSEIYSLGVVMYEMMTGRPPYDGDTPVSVAIQHINGNPPMPSTLNPNIPGGLEQIIMKAMEQNPGKRYLTTNAMLTDMDEFRKNPTILFDYNNPDTDMDAATKMTSPSRKEEETMPLPRAVVPRAGERAEPPKRPAQRPARKPAKPASSRYSEEIIEDEPRGSKAATIAIWVCVAVALVAIAILVAVIVNSGANSQNDIITVPNLLGKTQSELLTMDIVVRLGYMAYSDKYAEGQIYGQEPVAGSKIAKGGIVTIYVSLGPEPEEKVMVDLVELSEENAIDFLVNVLGVDRNNILVRTDHNSTVDAGLVTRTDPKKDEELTNGPIQIWISAGPKVQTAMVQDVVGQTEERAIAILNGYGFKNVIIKEVPSTKRVGTVVSQSEEPKSVIDITTPITLEVSIGEDVQDNPGQGETPPEPPVVDPDLKSKVVTVPIPVEMQEPYTLEIWQGDVLIAQREMPVGTVSTQFSLSGKGTVEYTAKLSNGTSWTIEVKFDEPDE